MPTDNPPPPPPPPPPPAPRTDAYTAFREAVDQQQIACFDSTGKVPVGHLATTLAAPYAGEQLAPGAGRKHLPDSLFAVYQRAEPQLGPTLAEAILLSWRES